MNLSKLIATLIVHLNRIEFHKCVCIAVEKQEGHFILRAFAHLPVVRLSEGLKLNVALVVPVAMYFHSYVAFYSFHSIYKLSHSTEGDNNVAMYRHY